MASLQMDELLALQALDHELWKLQQEIEALDHGERVERALAVRQARLTAAERRLERLESEQRASELELKSLEEKKHTSSRKLYEGRITAPRELQALEMEITMLERQRQRLDETILRRGDEVDSAREAVDTARASVEEAEKALKVVRRRFEREKTRLKKGLEEISPKRERLAGTLEPDVLRRYDAIRHRNHNLAAVRIENGACGGCRMQVGGAVMRRVSANDAYVYCESCTRFLFPPVEEAEPVPATRTRASARRR
jgi:uncharacterized protein